MNIPISKFVIKDRHGNILRSDSFTTVAQVVVNADDGVGEASADSSYEEGVLRINFHNIKADSIKQITFEESQEDGGTNYLHVKMTSDSDTPSYTFPIKNGRRGNGITSINVEESQEDGGDNIIHIHCTDDEEVEGTQFRVKNGRRGNGIASSSENLSNEDGGTNTHTFKDDKGENHVFHTKNGRTGSRGESVLVGQDDLPLTHELGGSAKKAMSQVGVQDSLNEEMGEFTETETVVVGKTYSAAVDGKFMGTNGSESEAANWHYMSYPVVVGKKYTIKTVAGQTARAWLLLAADGTVLSYDDDSSTASEKDKEVTIPDDGTVTMVVNYRQTSESTRPLEVKEYVTQRHLSTTDDIEENNALPVTSQGVFALKEALEEEIEEVAASQDITPELENYTEVLPVIVDVPNGDISTYDNAAYQSAPRELNGWLYITFPVVVGKKYKIKSAAGQQLKHWLLLDSEGSVVASDDSESSVAIREKEITVNDDDAVLMAVNTRKITMATPEAKVYEDQRFLAKTSEAEEGNDLPITSGGVRRLVDGNILYGKTLCVCGDSITEGGNIEYGENPPMPFDANVDIEMYQWSSSQWNLKTENARNSYGYQIAKRNKMKFYNGGVSGTTIQVVNGSGFSLANGRYTQLPNEIDYLLIWFGWNDRAKGSLGTIDDDTNETYYGAYNVVLPYLINKYPYTKIALVVPYLYDSNNGAEMREAVRLLANKWGVACYDFYKGGTPLFFGKETVIGLDADVQTANRAKFLTDGTHPNYYGHKQLSEMIEGFLRTI